MPLFEFRCRTCECDFEVLVRPDSAAPRCLRCGSSDLERLLSLFAVSSESTRSNALASGRRRAAKEQRDSAIAAREHEIAEHH